MKKLIIAACAVALAGAVQAATCQWGSGALKTATSADGGWSNTFVQNANALVTMNVYFITADTYASLASASQETLYNTYKTQTASLTGQNKNANTGALIGAITINDATTAEANAMYAVVTATYTDATYGDMYMATRAASTYVAATQKGQATSIFGSVANWQAASLPTPPTPGPEDAPEPTSGLLMLFGAAGLALRRKRA